MHRAIRLPGEEPAATLLRFVHVYVGEVPDLLEAAASVADQAGLDAQVRPLLRLAEAFFLSPPALLDGHHGLEAILDEAYLAHRLVEEVNDRYILHFGQPLIPLDTTAANLVAHALIGDALRQPPGRRRAAGLRGTAGGADLRQRFGAALPRAARQPDAGGRLAALAVPVAAPRRGAALHPLSANENAPRA